MFKDLLKKKLVRKFTVLGDSHAKVFQHINLEFYGTFFFNVKLVGGATAFGLANPNSKTNAIHIFKKELKTINKDIIIILGEVDTGYLIWWRSLKYGTPVKQEFESSLSRYKDFILWMLNEGKKNITIVSAPLPTIKDNFHEFGEVAGERNAVKASQLERTSLTLAYNEELKNFCNEIGIVFLDTTKYMLDHKTGLIKSEFLNENPLDHHCNNETYSKAILKEIKSRKLVRFFFLIRRKHKAPKKVENYWEKRANAYGRRAVLNLGHEESEIDSVTNHQINKIFPHLDNIKNKLRVKDVLDYGCGPGRFSLHLANYFNANVTAVDPVKKFLELAPKSTNVSYYNLQEFNFSNRKFDFLWICLVLGGISNNEIKNLSEKLCMWSKPETVLCLIENTSTKLDAQHWKFRPFDFYQDVFKAFNLQLIDTYDDLGEEISIMIGSYQ